MPFCVDQPTTAPPGHPQYVRRGWDVAERWEFWGGMWQSGGGFGVGCERAMGVLGWDVIERWGFWGGM